MIHKRLLKVFVIALWTFMTICSANGNEYNSVISVQHEGHKDPVWETCEIPKNCGEGETVYRITSYGSKGYSPKKHDICRLRDCDATTRWSADGKGSWAMFELVQESMLNRVKIAWTHSRYNLFAIQLSMDGLDFATVYVDSGKVTKNTFYTYSFPTQKTKYVRIIGQGYQKVTADGGRAKQKGGWLNFTEIEFHKESSTSLQNKSGIPIPKVPTRDFFPAGKWLINGSLEPGMKVQPSFSTPSS